MFTKIILYVRCRNMPSFLFINYYDTHVYVLLGKEGKTGNGFVKYIYRFSTAFQVT